MAFNYAVVQFIETSEVSEVPASWITEDKTHCRWPLKSAKSYLEKGVKPKESWNHLRVKVYKYANTLEAAKSLADSIIAESETEGSAESSLKRKRIMKDVEREGKKSKVAGSPAGSSQSDSLISDTVVSPQGQKNKSDSTVPPQGQKTETVGDTTKSPYQALSDKVDKIASSLEEQLKAIKEIGETTKRNKEILLNLRGKVKIMMGAAASHKNVQTSLEQLKGMDEFKELEKSLGEPEFFEGMVEEFVKIGGNSATDHALRILTQMMVPALATHFTKSGVKDKEGNVKKEKFIATNLMKGIKAATSKKFPNIDLKSLEASVGNWLKNRTNDHNKAQKNLDSPSAVSTSKTSRNSSVDASSFILFESQVAQNQGDENEGDDPDGDGELTDMDESS